MTVLTLIECGNDTPAPLDEVVGVIDDFLAPALAGLRVAASSDDAIALRAYAYELVFLTGCIMSTCPAPEGERPAP